VAVSRVPKQGGEFARIINREEIGRRQAEFVERSGACGDDGGAHRRGLDHGVSETLIRAGADDELGEFVESGETFVGNKPGETQMRPQSGMAVNGRVEGAGKRSVFGGEVARDHERGRVRIGREGGGVGLEKEGEVFVESKTTDVEPEAVGKIEFGFELCELGDRWIERVVAREPVVDGVDLRERNPVQCVELLGGELRDGENPAALQLADAETATEAGAPRMIG